MPTPAKPGNPQSPTQQAQREMHLATDWQLSEVEKCVYGKDGESLVEFLDARYRKRFFLPIALLKTAKGNDQGYGMAMMSLCSLLIESIQCLRDGLPSTSKRELREMANYSPPREYEVPEGEWKQKDALGAFKSFFTRFRSHFPDVDGEDFYHNIRCGLLHQAQTKGGWRIKTCRSKLCDVDDKVIDRDLFAKALEDAFKSYLDELRAAPADSDLWIKARRKIWWLIQLSK